MNNIISIKKIKECFSIDTCHKSYKNKWSLDNASAGQCAVASLVYQEKYGGDIYKTKVGSSSHYYNVVNGNVIDLTSEQFNKSINYEKGILCNRKNMLKVKDTKQRYDILLDRVNTL